ncbi:MAG: hypothetical protein PHW82_16270 [Bacteroidales bacterium]|nr:hypothetical protein [Bacteroidales bacterium]
MERTNLNILFFIRKNKEKQEATIFLRLTVNGERAEFGCRHCLYKAILVLLN